MNSELDTREVASSDIATEPVQADASAQRYLPTQWMGGEEKQPFMQHNPNKPVAHIRWTDQLGNGEERKRKSE